jgi:hypothetical protein
MSKKTKIIIFSIIAILVLGSTSFLFFYKNKVGNNGFDVMLNTLPFGKDTETIPNTSTPKEKNVEVLPNEGQNNVAIPKLFQLHKTAIAGAYSTERQKKNNKSEKEDFIRYMERGIGHIFETNLSNLKEERVSNTTRLKIHEAIWGDNGQSVIIRYLDEEDKKTIRSFLIKLQEESSKNTIQEENTKIQTSKETEGIFLPENIQNITVLETNDKKIFYLLNLGDSIVGTIYNIDNGNTSQIFQSPFTEWTAQWPTKKTIVLTTKPSEKIPGFVYFLNTQTEVFTKILEDINGLTTLTSPDAKKILYSESTRDGFTLNIYKTSTNTTETLPLNTLPEKCVWSKINTAIIYCSVPNNPQPGSYPDEWYQGVKSFTDNIWMINTETYTTNQIIDLNKESGDVFDIINPQLSLDEKFLFFTNKKDLSLWGVSLE